MGILPRHYQHITVENLPAAIFIYLVVTAVGSVAFALPGISFAILAGLLFGPVLGTICCTVAATLGAVAAFLLGRYFLKDTVGAAARKNPYLRRLLFDETGKKQIWILMITRLVPLFPYNLQNFAYGVTMTCHLKPMRLELFFLCFRELPCIHLEQQVWQIQV